jgi:predicted TIM-barrel fold metal-dependent hydrolase
MQRREFLAGMAAIGASALVPDILEGAQTRPSAPAFRIDVHNHGNSPGFIAAIKAHNTGQTALMNWTPAKALEDMDRDGVATVIMSTSEPGVHFGDGADARALARECNEYFARLVSDRPTRFWHVCDAAPA